MTLGSMNTNRTWADVLEGLEDELRKWGIDDYLLPTLGQARKDGQVALRVARDDSDDVRIECSHFTGEFNGAVKNLLAISKNIRNCRLAEQRGMGAVLMQTTKLLKLDAYDPNKVLGVAPNAPDSEKKQRYHELIKQYHPDTPGSGNRAMFEIVQKAAQDLGLG